MTRMGALKRLIKGFFPNAVRSRLQRLGLKILGVKHLEAQVLETQLELRRIRGLIRLHEFDSLNSD